MRQFRFMLASACVVCGLMTSAFAAAHSTQPAKAAHAVIAKVDVNSATAAELTTIKGIGAKRAAMIVSYRKQHGHFASIDDLTQIKGISSKTLARWQKLNPGRLVVKK